MLLYINEKLHKVYKKLLKCFLEIFKIDGATSVLMRGHRDLLVNKEENLRLAIDIQPYYGQLFCKQWLRPMA